MRYSIRLCRARSSALAGYPRERLEHHDRHDDGRQDDHEDEREETQRAVLDGPLCPPDSGPVVDLDLYLLAPQAILDRLLMEGGLELRE